VNGSLLILETYINVIILKIEKNQILSTIRIILKGLVVLFYTIFVIALLSGGLSAGILTLTPHEASRPNFLGYYSLCSFVPFSTMILFSMAIIGAILLVKLVKYYKRALKRVKIKSPKLMPNINY
jgi:hypothetical protein